MKIGVPKQTQGVETRTAITPDAVQRFLKKFPDLEIIVEKGAGAAAGFDDAAYKEAGAKAGSSTDALGADIVLTISPLTETKGLKKGALLAGFLDPLGNAEGIEALAKAGVNAMAVEKIPRTSRAQSMDALSSQTNIAGYRAVLEATQHFNRFFPVMMTAAGSSKPANVIILGVGVAGLQAVATARRLGANVSAFDIRPEVKEQIESLGAKFIEIDTGEEGSGEGGYAKELSEEGKKKQQQALQDILKKADVVITTAQIPGRPAPVLLPEETVKGMAPGSIVIDMAAGGFNQANGIAGGNCPLTEADEVVERHGVKLVGHTNYAAFVAKDASQFYARNLFNLMQLVLTHEDGKTSLNLNLEDDIIAGALATLDGEVR